MQSKFSTGPGHDQEESASCCAWVWVEDPTKIATRGTLSVEEPLDQASASFHGRFLESFQRRFLENLCDEPSRSEPVSLLAYPILIHLDRIHDFSVEPVDPPFRGSPASSHSDTSGIPIDDLGSPPRDESAKWHYRWNLHFEDGTFPPRQQRGPVHSCLNFDGRNDQDGPGDGAPSGRSGGGANPWPIPHASGSGGGSDSLSRHGAQGHHHGRQQR
ncbi:hypothetical protein D1007_23247 [Hordeum vulgare]|nr:hypothetical protein D1007_23247 [Hordeum vulgare]